MTEPATQPTLGPASARGWARRFAPVGQALVVAAIAEIIALFRYRVWQQSFTVPLNRAGTDHLYMASLIRSVHDTGWYFTNPHLGAPFGQQLYDFPQAGESFQILAFRFLGLFSSRPFAVMNIYYLAGFAAVAFVTYLVLVHLRFRFLVAAPITILYTWLPYHIMHGEFHLFRSAFVSAPLAMLVIFWVLSWQDRFLVDPDGPVWGLGRLTKNLRWSRVAAAVALCVFIGAFETMVMAFMLVAMVVAACVAAIANRDISRLAVAAVAAAIIAATFFVLFLPNASYKLDHGPNTEAASRYPSEQITYGLQISKMVLPVGQHHVSALGRFSQRSQEHSVAPGEAGQNLGLLGTAGLLGLLWGAIVPRLGSWRGGDPYDRRRLWKQSAIVTLTLILFGTMSGFALVLSTLGLSQIRVWGRAVILIAFCALLCVAMALERVLVWVERVVRTRGNANGTCRVRRPGVGRRVDPRRLAGLAVATLLVTAVTVFGLWDTDTGEASSLTNAADNAQATTLTRFTDAIQAKVGPGAAVFQVPVVPFPEVPTLHRMHDYDELLPYLFSRDLSFSYGGTRGRPDADWKRKVDNANPVPALAGLRGLGFEGVLVDTYGFGDAGQQISAQLSAALGSPVLTSEGGRWQFWDLGTFAIEHQLSPAQLHDAATDLVGETLMERVPGP